MQRLLLKDESLIVWQDLLDITGESLPDVNQLKTYLSQPFKRTIYVAEAPVLHFLYILLISESDPYITI